MTALAPVRWSHLRWMRQSPAHYRYSVETGFPTTAPMLFGTLVHRMVFEPSMRLAVYDGARRGKAWDQFELDHSGEEIVTATEYERAKPVADAVRACEIVTELLGQGEVERQLSWTINGRECRGRPDILCHDAILDLKVTDPNPDKLRWQAARMGWLAQLDWYDYGAGDVGRKLYIIAVEAKPPYCVTPMFLTENAVSLGRRTWRLAWERLMVCERSGQWPGYVQSPVPLDADEDLTLTIENEEVTL